MDMDEEKWLNKDYKRSSNFKYRWDSCWRRAGRFAHWKKTEFLDELELGQTIFLGRIGESAPDLSIPP